MSSIYNVGYAQTVEITLVTGRHPGTQSHVMVSHVEGECTCLHVCVFDLLVSNVQIWPDLINMSGWSSVSQQEILQL